MGAYENAAAYLPPLLRETVLQVPAWVREITQELRLRAGAPVTLSTPRGEWLVTQDGQVTQGDGARLLFADMRGVEECFERLCDHSIHSHQQEICRGYVSTRTGCRAGLAGTAVCEGGRVVSLRQITSVCIRVARRHDGCAAALARRLTAAGRVEGALLIGEPASGKTSLLRDLAEQLSGGMSGRRWRVAVVDERGELAGVGGLRGCDVLRFCPKGEGIQQAVRALAPDVVLLDELGDMDEVRAVLAGLHAGVAVIATAHGRDRLSV